MCACCRRPERYWDNRNTTLKPRSIRALGKTQAAVIAIEGVSMNLNLYAMVSAKAEDQDRTLFTQCP